MSFLEYPLTGRAALKLSDTKSLEKGLDTVQEGHSARLFYAETVQYLVKEAVRKNIDDIPKRYREGVRLTLNSDTYRGLGGNITRVIVVWSRGEWRVSSINRREVLRADSRVEMEMGAEQVSLVLDKFLSANSISIVGHSKGVLEAPLQDMPGYLAGGDNDAEIAAARLRHGWDIKEEA